MVEAALKGVFENLSSLIGKELGLFLGFDQDLKKRLASLLTAILAMHEDAEEKQFSDISLKDWLLKLRDAAHELDDIMDECAYEKPGLEFQGIKFKPGTKLLLILFSSQASCFPLQNC